jgi:hypothetical protein
MGDSKYQNASLEEMKSRALSKLWGKIAHQSLTIAQATPSLHDPSTPTRNADRPSLAVPDRLSRQGLGRIASALDHAET